MMDIMYFGYDWDKESYQHQVEFIQEIKQKFPNVILKNAYDQIKGYRQEVYLDEEQEDDYMAFLLGNGWYNLSFSLQLSMRTTEAKEKVLKWIELAKKQYSNEEQTEKQK